MNRVLSWFACSVAALAFPALAQFEKPEDAVHYRQSAFALMGAHAGRINAQLKSSAPDVAAIQASATLIATLSKLPYEAFVPGSDLVASTKMKPEALRDSARVNELAEKMQTEAAKLAAVSRDGDLKSIAAQFSTLGRACKACHDDYKMK